MEKQHKIRIKSILSWNFQGKVRNDKENLPNKKTKINIHCGIT